MATGLLTGHSGAPAARGWVGGGDVRGEHGQISRSLPTPSAPTVLSSLEKFCAVSEEERSLTISTTGPLSALQ